MPAGIPLSVIIDAERRPSGSINNEMRSAMNCVARIQERASGPAPDDYPWWDIDAWDEADGYVQDTLINVFPHGPRELLDLLSAGYGHSLDVSFGNELMSVFDTGSGAGPIESLKRLFDFGTGSVSLSELFLHPEAQGEGIGLKILTGTVKAAKMLGMKRLNLEANFLGAYVWARAGFLPQPDGGLGMVPRSILTKLENARSISPAVKAKVKNIVEKGGRKMLWQIADLKDTLADSGRTKVGKALLKGETWHGVFEIGNAEQEARLKAYAKSRDY